MTTITNKTFDEERTLFGLPVGAVGTMTVQHTLSSGIKAGLFTGLGSSVADCFCGFVSTR